MYYQIQIRRGTASEWTAANSILAAGELAVETDTNKMKVGNGSTAWASLAYATATPTQLNLKADLASPTFTGNVVLPSTTSIGTVSATEIGYVDGVTSAIQTQLDSKLTATTAVTSNRNAIINGGMDIYQRGSISAAGYALDRWYFSTYGTSWNSLSVTQQTSGAPTNFRYYMRVAAGSATSTNISFGQSLETHNVIKLAGKVVNLSFYYRVNTNFSTAFTVTPVFTTGTDANISTVPNGTAIGSAQTVTNTTAWTRFSYSFTVPSNATSFAIQFWNNNNTVSTASLDITGVQLDAGSVATPFEFEDYGVTLAKCQRYFNRAIDFSADNGGTATQHAVMVGQNFASTGGYGAFIYPRMRTSPVVTFSGASHFFAAGAGGNNIATTAMQANAIKPTSCEIRYTVASGLGTGDASFIYTSSSTGKIDLSAEL